MSRAASAMSGTGRLRVLLVEDNRADRRLVEETLGGAVDLETVETLREALHRLERGGADVILLDLTLPDSAGLDTVQRMVAGAPDIPVVAFTVYGDEDLITEALAAGAQDYLVKGEFDERLLFRVVRFAVERGRLLTELRRAKALAEGASRAKSEFISRTSHELRTPLTAVVGYAQLLELDDLDDNQRDAVARIRKAGKHLVELIDDILDVARVEQGKVELSIEPVDLPALVTETLELVRPMARTRQIEMRTGAAPEMHLAADLQRLRQVMLNLLSNALKYNREGGSVTVSWERRGERVRVDVADTGVGIAPADLQRLFTPYARVGPVACETEGTGLGLALSRSLVEAMGGTLTVQSAAGEGSTFTVELPVSAAPSELPVGTEAATGVVVGGRVLVLHIEDNPMNAHLFERVLARRPGARLLSAPQGGLGIELARQHRPSIVFLDMHLPDMNGEQVLAALRSEPVTRTIPVVVLSGDASKATIDAMLDAGATHYLTKPVDIHRLLDLVDQVATTRPHRFRHA